MEQFRSPVPEKAEHVSPVQIIAFVLGILGFLLSLIVAFLTLAGFVLSFVNGPDAFGVSAVLPVIAILCGLAAVVLGIIGLALDRKKQQRTAGIVFSVLGLSFGAFGLFFLLLAGFWAGLFSVLLRLTAQ